MKSSFCSQHKWDPSLLRELYEVPPFDWPLSVTPSVRSGSIPAAPVRNKPIRTLPCIHSEHKKLGIVRTGSVIDATNTAIDFGAPNILTYGQLNPSAGTLQRLGLNFPASSRKFSNHAGETGFNRPYRYIVSIRQIQITGRADSPGCGHKRTLVLRPILPRNVWLQSADL